MPHHGKRTPDKLYVIFRLPDHGGIRRKAGITRDRPQGGTGVSESLEIRCQLLPMNLDLSPDGLPKRMRLRYRHHTASAFHS